MPTKKDLADKLLELVSVADDAVPEERRSHEFRRVLREAANMGNVAIGRPDLVQPEIEDE